MQEVEKLRVKDRKILLFRGKKETWIRRRNKACLSMPQKFQNRFRSVGKANTEWQFSFSSTQFNLQNKFFGDFSTWITSLSSTLFLL